MSDHLKAEILQHAYRATVEAGSLAYGFLFGTDDIVDALGVDREEASRAVISLHAERLIEIAISDSSGDIFRLASAGFAAGEDAQRLERDAHRLTVLKAMATMTSKQQRERPNRPPDKIVFGPKNVSEHTGLSVAITQEALAYLRDKGIVEASNVELRAPQGLPTIYRITAAGHDAIANQSAVPSIPSVTINQTVNGPIGAMQFGAGSSASVVQNINENAAELLALIQGLKDIAAQIAELVARQQVEDDLANLEDEVQAAEPSPRRIRSFVRSLLSHAPTAIVTANQLWTLADRLGLTSLLAHAAGRHVPPGSLT